MGAERRRARRSIAVGVTESRRVFWGEILAIATESRCANGLRRPRPPQFLNNCQESDLPIVKTRPVGLQRTVVALAAYCV